MPSSLDDLHKQVNAKQPKYSSVKNATDGSIVVYINGVQMNNRIVYDVSSDRVFICNGGGVSVGSATVWLNSLQ